MRNVNNKDAEMHLNVKLTCCGKIILHRSKPMQLSDMAIRHDRRHKVHRHRHAHVRLCLLTCRYP
jgi:hypothetical protein